LLGVDDLVLRDQSGATVPRLYALHDTMHVAAVADASGTLLERYGYDAFGNTRVMDGSFNIISASIYDWETRFCGYRWDGESGLYQVRYRYLHSALGRWLSRDPIEFASGDINLYRMVGNNAIQILDPSGMEALTCVEGLAWGWGSVPWGATILGVLLIGGVLYIAWRLCKADDFGPLSKKCICICELLHSTKVVFPVVSVATPCRSVKMQYPDPDVPEECLEHMKDCECQEL
jgi:RHS repeat-associated protein